jgi:hemerythrin-like domain-containing protein
MGTPDPSRKASRAFPDPPAGFDDPLEMLFGCHRRIEKQLETLKRLRVHLQAKGIDAEASTAAEAVLRYFRKAATDHHADEEVDVFPMLERRIDDAIEAARFRDLRERLEADHRRVEDAWTKIRKPLEGIADGLMRTIAESDLLALTALYSAHIHAEETELRVLFDRWLGPREREALGHAMAARRGVPFAPG